MTEDTWYFAYGSNLSMDRKEKRTGCIREARVAHLPGYRLAFNKQGENGEVYANIMPADGDEVWGVIYRCNPEAMAKLDHCEGVDSGHYTREQVTAITRSGDAVPAETYIAGEGHLCEEGRPSDRYLNCILSGAKEHGLPADYIRRVEAIARPSPAAGC